LTKGGRPATDEEKARLAGFSTRGIPKGLSQCEVCGMGRGECLDPKTDVFKDKVMKVYCRCENDNLCARCGRPLYEYKLNAIEAKIAALEEQRETLSARLYDEDVFRDGRKVREVSAELDGIEKQLLQLNKEWEAVIEAAG
jgi:hypothetical protein